ncbi:1803_t:CDS:1, partial [Paraglomus occultum]
HKIVASTTRIIASTGVYEEKGERATTKLSLLGIGSDLLAAL